MCRFWAAATGDGDGPAISVRDARVITSGRGSAPSVYTTPALFDSAEDPGRLVRCLPVDRLLVETNESPRLPVCLSVCSA